MVRDAGPANRITGTAAAGKSRFWRAPGGATPALNADAVQLLGVFKYLPHTFDQRAWTTDEDSKLREVVMAQVKVPCPPRPVHAVQPSPLMGRIRIMGMTHIVESLNSTLLSSYDACMVFLHYLPV